MKSQRKFMKIALVDLRYIDQYAVYVVFAGCCGHLIIYDNVIPFSSSKEQYAAFV